MQIRTRPASGRIFLEARTPTDDDAVTTQVTVSFQLLPTEEHDHLDLDTGEVFQDYNYARLDKNEKKLIDASITIRELPDDSHYQYNLMLYVSEHKGDDLYFPSSIRFDVFIAPAAFRELSSNLRSGVLPATITIELPSPSFFTSADRDKKDPVEYGWAPDGSELIWHNKENPKISVKSIKFDFPVVTPRRDKKKDDHVLPIYAPTEHILEQIAPIQTILAALLKHLRWTMIGIIALVTMIGILIARQQTPF